ncbi:hypothetical protein J6590_042100 [Homalodisca vitripennis]|nr:hypothetical protein J6590_088053 [Homalodisca vitripennis]KAG8336581.1 hypothetical protein J6590_042100 [Homalodisca vitripennis]
MISFEIPKADSREDLLVRNITVTGVAASMISLIVLIFVHPWTAGTPYHYCSNYLLTLHDPEGGWGNTSPNPVVLGLSCRRHGCPDADSCIEPETSSVNGCSA